LCLLASQNSDGGNLSIETSEEEINTLSIFPTVKMFHYAWDWGPAYPSSDGTVIVKYLHKKTTIPHLRYKKFFSLAGAEQAIIYNDEEAYVKINALNDNWKPFSETKAYDYLCNHIEEVKAKAIEAIPAAKEATNIVVEHGYEVIGDVNGNDVR